MKKGFKYLFCLFLISALLASGLPVLSPEDADRDQRIDLKDAILHLQQMTQPTENKGTFKSHLQNAFETFYVLAGLKTVIKEDNSAKSGTTLFVLDSPYLITSAQLFIPEDRGMAIFAHTFRYHSISIAPTSPPPKTV